jgi:hypothetical protein
LGLWQTYRRNHVVSGLGWGDVPFNPVAGGGRKSKWTLRSQQEGGPGWPSSDSPLTLSATWREGGGCPKSMGASHPRGGERSRGPSRGRSGIMATEVWPVGPCNPAPMGRRFPTLDRHWPPGSPMSGAGTGGLALSNRCTARILGEGGACASGSKMACPAGH